MAYPVDKIRNVCLLGHGGEGKTSLAESLLYRTGGTDRLGKIVDGNTVCDFDPEEVKRQISISTALAPVEYEGNIINIIDTPGYFDFAGEVAQALRVADSAVIVVSAKGGCNVGAEKAWKAAGKIKLPHFFYISKIDEENADFDKAYESLREKFGNSVTPFVIPLFEDGNKPVGVVNVVTRTAWKADGVKMIQVDVPAEKMEKINRLRAALCESVATNSDELLERFLNGEDFTDEELLRGLREVVRAGDVAPVLCGSAFTGVGTMQLCRMLIDFAPAPNEVRTEKGTNENGEPVELHYDPNGKAVVMIFKTVADQYGKVSYFKVMSGKLAADTVLVNSRTGTSEKFGHIFLTKGKKTYEVKEIGCGDIGAASKLIDSKTGDTLCLPGVGITLTGIDFAEPCYSQCIAPKVKGNEDKIAAGLIKMKDEDPSFTIINNSETKQMVVAGAGDIQLDVLCSKLRNKFAVEVELSAPKVPYREKIRKKVSTEGKHRKQSGGHGQYGHVKMDFEPYSEGDYLFEEHTFGGSVPKNFHPAVDKGIRESMEHGVLAGYPLVGLKAVLTDGSYHDVDSNELSFKMAAKLAYKAGIPLANPAIMEPICSMKICVPDSYMGDVMGDLNKRRGRIMGMNPDDDGNQVIEAEAPQAEISDYAIALRSMTQARGTFTYKFERYEDAPPAIQEKVIAESKNLVETAED